MNSASRQDPTIRDPGAELHWVIPRSLDSVTHWFQPTWQQLPPIFASKFSGHCRQIPVFVVVWPCPVASKPKCACLIVKSSPVQRSVCVYLRILYASARAPLSAAWFWGSAPTPRSVVGGSLGPKSRSPLPALGAHSIHEHQLGSSSRDASVCTAHTRSRAPSVARLSARVAEICWIRIPDCAPAAARRLQLDRISLWLHSVRLLSVRTSAHQPLAMGLPGLSSEYSPNARPVSCWPILQARHSPAAPLGAFLLTRRPLIMLTRGGVLA
ncbi:hypothetical protein C8Q79DRAFT_107760 [Trametes meyenii]|nr:hypothetical protein C8Q79DRAFT_107760 [Trametes meyenii]